MSPFRTSTDWSGFQYQAGRVNVGVETSTSAAPDLVEAPAPTLHWWQRLGHKKSAVGATPHTAPGASHEVH